MKVCVVLLLVMGMVAAVAAMAGQCDADVFRPGPSWKTEANVISVKGPSQQDIDVALKQKPKSCLRQYRLAKRETKPPTLCGLTPNPVKCPYEYRYVFQIGGCWVIWPIFPRYVVCRTRKCRFWPFVRGFCRRRCFHKYARIVTLCYNSNGIPYCVTHHNRRLPQVCKCVRCPF